MPRKTTKKVAKKRTAAKKLLPYKLTVLMNDEVFTCNTDDIESALSQLKPEKVKTSVVVAVENKVSAFERIFNAAQARRLFTNHVTLKVFAKHALLSLKPV